MKQAGLRSVWFAALAVEVAFLGIVACGSGSSESPDASARDAGRDANRQDVAPHRRTDAGTPSADVFARDALAQDAGSVPGAVALCQAEYAASVRCNVVSPACLAALRVDGSVDPYAQECAAGWSMYEGNAYLQALADCLNGPAGLGGPNGCCFINPTTGCQDAAIALAETAEQCAVSKLASATPDPTDEQLRADFCSTCPDTDSKLHACAGFFNLAEAGIPDGALLDAGALVGAFSGLGVGGFVFFDSDSVVRDIDMSCTGARLAAFDAGIREDAGGLECFVRFALCAQAAAQSYVQAHPPPSGDAESLPAACRPEAGATGSSGGAG